MPHLALRRIRNAPIAADSSIQSIEVSSNFTVLSGPIIGLTVTLQPDRFNRLPIVLSSVVKRVSRCFGRHRSVKAFMM
jgi:hypothetical protein